MSGLTLPVGSVGQVTLGLGEWAVSTSASDVLICLGLGSCVAFVAYDARAAVGGMAHMVLPDSTQGRPSTATQAKFVDLAVPLVVAKIEAAGGHRAGLIVHLVGGAHILRTSREGDSMNIGLRNVLAARHAIELQRLRIESEQVGGTQGRTVRLDISTGSLLVSTGRGSAG